MGIHDSIFEGNKAGTDGGAYVSRVMSGGINNSIFKKNTASGYGGAVVFVGKIGSSSDLDGGINNSIFDGNHVVGKSTAFSSGLGGAILLGGNLEINGSTFIKNMADTKHIGDDTSGRGGAIFFNGKANQSVNLIAANVNSPILFLGNMHNPGGAGQTANSIYFGSRALASSLPLSTVNLTLNAAIRANIEMFDPMMSQEDYLLNPSGLAYGKVEVNIEKVGQGRWGLSGHNDMRGAGRWQISQGSLFLSGNTPPPA